MPRESVVDLFQCVPSMTRVIAIGDVHGCAAALRAVLRAIDPGAGDTLVVLGDCVDRGPESRQVIEELLSLREQCHLVPILGNHEEMMLNYLEGRPQPDDWLQCGGRETLASYGGDRARSRGTRSAATGTAPNDFSIPEEHVTFIRGWVDHYETSSHFFVHASYEPERSLANQHWQTMRWQSLKFGVPAAHVSGKMAVVGHSAQKSGEVFREGHLVCIDTYCWGGGWLTAHDTTTGQFWQADRQGRLRNR